jgi:acyl transferase domain-containing protein
MEMKTTQTAEELSQIAIIGMAGRFAGAPTLKAFWHNLVSGVESVSFFSRDELLSAGIPERLVADPRYIRAKAFLEGADRFDARYFDFSTREATVMDPQFRVFLETAAEALEDAGYTADESSRRTGIFAGGNSNTYQEYLRAHPELIQSIGHLQATILNEKDFLPTWAAYKLNLTGPCVTVQNACATSLVAVHLACQSLLNGECDIALAGGVSLSFPQREGYLYVEGGALSPDGRCRAFDAKALGSVPGEGVGVVALCRLGDALAQGDAVRAIVKASSINNDGTNKIGYLAPSERGIATAVAESLEIAGVSCESIGYVEAHGGGTPLGDPIEIAALTRSFRAQTAKSQFCAIGSVKTNVGNLNAAAGVAGLIKMVLALEHGVIPPSLHFEEPNPLIKFEQTPFYVNTRAVEWAGDGGPRRGGVNAFGLGGTNVHLILEEAPRRARAEHEERAELLVLSARSEAALAKASENLAAHLEESPNTSLSSVAYTLGVGRRVHEHRRVVACGSVADAVKQLRAGGPGEVVVAGDGLEEPSLVFVFRDRGGAYVGLGSGLYRDEPVFRQEVDRCAEVSKPLVACDLRRLITHDAGTGSDTSELLSRGTVSAALSFTVQLALAKLLDSRGLRPQAVTGEGTGRCVVACIAGRLSVEEALRLAVREAAAPADAEHASHASAEFSRPTPAHDAPAAMTYAEVNELSEPVLLEIGPRAACDAEEGACLKGRLISTMRREREAASDREKLLHAVGQLWLARVPLDWHTFYSDEGRQRIPLPTYPFERRRYWVGESVADAGPPAAQTHAADEEESPAAGFAEKDDEPANDLQAVVAEVWTMFLGRERIGMHEGFYELGGNSLVATRIVLTIREILQVDLPLRSILEYPTVAGFAAEIESAARQLDTDVHQIARVVREISALKPEQVSSRLAGVEAEQSLS